MSRTIRATEYEEIPIHQFAPLPLRQLTGLDDKGKARIDRRLNEVAAIRTGDPRGTWRRKARALAQQS